jgi:hypothetical protein
MSKEVKDLALYIYLKFCSEAETVADMSSEERIRLFNLIAQVSIEMATACDSVASK